MARRTEEEKGVLILLVVVFLSVIIQQAILYHFDNQLEGKVQIIKTEDGRERWILGVIPEIKEVSETMVEEKSEHGAYKVWARKGDYSGPSVMGITCAIAAIMYLVWYAIILGFPNRMDDLRPKIAAIILIIAMIVIINLAFMRMTADFIQTTSDTGDPPSVLKVTSAHLSLSINNAGILFAIIVHRLGIGSKKGDEGLPDLKPVRERPHAKFYKKVYAMMGLFAFITILEIVLISLNAAISEYAVDFSVWIIWAVVFLGHFGYYPKDWISGDRPKGLALMIGGTIVTIVVFIVIQAVTGGIISTAVASKDLHNEGLSLMLSCWMIFWLLVGHVAGYTKAES